MARYPSTHPEVRSIIDGLLVPGFVATGNVSALTRAVGSLAGAPPGQPHPARIVALLAEDTTKGINESTMELLQRAAASARGQAIPRWPVDSPTSRRWRAPTPPRG